MVIPLYFLVKMNKEEIDFVESGPYTEWEVAEIERRSHKYSAQKYKIFEVELPGKFVEK